MLAEGRAIGSKIGSGTARVVRLLADMERVQPGDAVADMTDPDWEPVMKRSAAIVTNRGGRTCHAAIIARDSGVPAVVVGTGNALDAIKDGDPVTVSCVPRATPASSTPAPCLRAHHHRPGKHAAGAAEDHDERGQPGPRLRLRYVAERGHRSGARLEMIIASHIGVHPNRCWNTRSRMRRRRRRSTRASPATPIRGISTSTG